MKENRDVQVNTFTKGMMPDASDIIMPSEIVRFGQNIRLVNTIGSSYVLTNISGTESAFTLTANYKPIAAQEFNGVLYIISWNNTVGSAGYGYVELGSYPSPKYDTPDNPNGTPAYRPLNNFDGGAFRTDAFGTSGTVKPVIQKLEIQPDYDRSVNLCFTIAGSRPRIVNTKFIAENNGTVFSIAPERRAGNVNSAASNSYTTASVNEETSLLLFSTQVMRLSLQGIQEGGKLKPGNYQYVFYYMTEDFNRTAVIGQSSVCQIAHGTSVNYLRGGDHTEETSKRVHLRLSNIDQDFKYIKVYFLYSSGEASLTQQYIELTRPTEISSDTMDFFHTGFEDTAEVSQDEVNIDYTPITSADASTQVGGYYFLANVSSNSVNWDSYRSASYNAVPTVVEKSISVLNSTLPGYADPSNVYNYMGYMGRETYPFGIVYIMKDGSLSPVFPIRGGDFPYQTPSQQPTFSPSNTNKGLITFPWSNGRPAYDSTIGSIKIKHLRIDVSAIATNNVIIQDTVGFFFVRGERRVNALTQALLIPTLKAPAVYPDADNYGYDIGNSGGSANGANDYYILNRNDIQVNDTKVYRHVINLDGIIEAYARHGNDGDASNRSVVNESGAIDDGYMPLWMYDGTGVNYDFQGQYGATPMPRNLWYSKTGDSYAKHWAMLSADAILNEPEYITSLSRESLKIHQLAKSNFVVKNNSQITPLALSSSTWGFHYDMNGNSWYNTFTTKDVKNVVFVDENSKGTGDFQGVMKTSLYAAPEDNDDSKHWLISQHYNSYFGIIMSDTNGQLTDSSKGATNPIGGNTRPGKAIDGGAGREAYVNYSNLGTTVPAGFLVNLYGSSGIVPADSLYPTVDGVTYKQISQRYSWADALAYVNGAGVAEANRIEVFGGDCYIGPMTRKLAHSPSPVETTEVDFTKRWNIDSGMVITWWQECKYNPYLRKPRQYDDSEGEKRSFFPYKSFGDIITYRKYRYPETNYTCVGNTILTPPKSFFKISDLSPTINNRFLNRVYHSEKHIPNAFKNGYRSFTPNNYRDYDSSMGAIIALFNHRGMLLVVFEHGVGITSIEQRVQTGADAAGAIFVEPSGVLPPTLMYVSREIGCQDPAGLVQTPTGVYGVDRAKDKIWKFTEGLKIISDEAVSSWIISNPIQNPRAGYDFENEEVIFTTTNWTLCYTEGFDKFTSFYTLNDAEFYARLNKNFYSFKLNQAHRHNADNFTIYGQERDVIVEFVVNKNASSAKVIDYLNLTSNEVPPSKIEVYSYNQEVGFGPVLQPESMNQYTRMENEYDVVDDQEVILYRDKKYVVQVGDRMNYGVGSTNDEWGWLEQTGRMRDKVFIVRLTYNTNKPLELASVLSYFRYSQS
jgi:frataxin-like iron-binding protein CyaY